MLAAISTSSTPRLPKAPSSTPPHRPPLSALEKTNHDNNNNNADDDDDSILRKSRSKPNNSPSSSSSILLLKRSQSNNNIPMSTTTTRSLYVSFQGQSFSFQATKSKPKPISQTPPKKLSVRTQQSNSLAKSLAAVRVLSNSVVFDDRDVLERRRFEWRRREAREERASVREMEQRERRELLKPNH